MPLRRVLCCRCSAVPSPRGIVAGQLGVVVVSSFLMTALTDPRTGKWPHFMQTSVGPSVLPLVRIN
jgi:hypothetical protein